MNRPRAGNPGVRKAQKVLLEQFKLPKKRGWECALRWASGVSRRPVLRLSSSRVAKHRLRGTSEFGGISSFLVGPACPAGGRESWLQVDDEPRPGQGHGREGRPPLVYQNRRVFQRTVRQQLRQVIVLETYFGAISFYFGQAGRPPAPVLLLFHRALRGAAV